MARCRRWPGRGTQEPKWARPAANSTDRESEPRLALRQEPAPADGRDEDDAPPRGPRRLAGRDPAVAGRRHPAVRRSRTDRQLRGARSSRSQACHTRRKDSRSAASAERRPRAAPGLTASQPSTLAEPECSTAAWPWRCTRPARPTRAPGVDDEERSCESAASIRSTSGCRARPPVAAASGRPGEKPVPGRRRGSRGDRGRGVPGRLWRFARTRSTRGWGVPGLLAGRKVPRGDLEQQIEHGDRCW